MGITGSALEWLRCYLTERSYSYNLVDCPRLPSLLWGAPGVCFVSFTVFVIYEAPGFHFYSIILKLLLKENRRTTSLFYQLFIHKTLKDFNSRKTATSPSPSHLCCHGYSQLFVAMVIHWCLLGGLAQQSVVSEMETNQTVNYVRSVHCTMCKSTCHQNWMSAPSAGHNNGLNELC